MRPARSWTSRSCAIAAGIPRSSATYGARPQRRRSAFHSQAEPPGGGPACPGPRGSRADRRTFPVPAWCGVSTTAVPDTATDSQRPARRETRPTRVVTAPRHWRKRRRRANAEAVTRAWSEALEEGEQAVWGPVASRSCVGRGGAGERPFLQGEVGVEVDLGRVDVFVAEPEGDDRGVDAGVQEPNRRRVA